MIDVVGDNEVSQEECIRFLTDAWGLEEADGLQAFRRLDTDGADDMLSRPEFLRTICQHFLHNDPDSPGQPLLRPSLTTTTPAARWHSDQPAGALLGSGS